MPSLFGEQPTDTSQVRLILPLLGTLAAITALIVGTAPATTVAEALPLPEAPSALVAPVTANIEPTSPSVAQDLPLHAPVGALEASITVPDPSTTTVASYVRFVQKEFELGDDFYGTLECESGFKWNAENLNDPGGSYGVSQINAPAHRDLTKDQMLDYRFAIRWAAEQFKAHNQAIWTCWRTHYGSDATSRTSAEP